MTALCPVARDTWPPSGYCSRRLQSHYSFRQPYRSNKFVFNDDIPQHESSTKLLTSSMMVTLISKIYTAIYQTLISKVRPGLISKHNNMSNLKSFRAHWSLKFLLKKRVSAELARKPGSWWCKFWWFSLQEWVQLRWGFTESKWERKACV